MISHGVESLDLKEYKNYLDTLLLVASGISGFFEVLCFFEFNFIVVSGV
jgi:hypothetical protein